MVVENVRRQSCGQVSPEVEAVLWVGARFAANHRLSTGGVLTRHVVGEVEVKKFFGQRAAIRVASAGEGPITNVLNGPIQLSESFALRTLASVPAWPIAGW